MHACAKGQHPISAAVTRPDWFELHAAELDPSVVSESVALAPTNPFRSASWAITATTEKCSTHGRSMMTWPRPVTLRMIFGTPIWGCGPGLTSGTVASVNGPCGSGALASRRTGASMSPALCAPFPCWRDGTRNCGAEHTPRSRQQRSTMSDLPPIGPLAVRHVNLRVRSAARPSPAGRGTWHEDWFVWHPGKSDVLLGGQPAFPNTFVRHLRTPVRRPFGASVLSSDQQDSVEGRVLMRSVLGGRARVVSRR